MSEDTQVTDEELEASLLGVADGNVDGEPTELDTDTAFNNVDEPDGNKKIVNIKTDAEWQKELNDTKSEFGRKLKIQEEQVTTLTNSVTELVTALKSGGIDGRQQEPEFDEDDPIPLTMGGLVGAVEKLLQKRDQGFEAKTSEYEQGYLKTVEKLGADYSDSVHKHIVDRMFKQFNIRHSNDPMLDARLNFRDAENVILREVRERKANPLAKNKGKRNKNLGGPTDSDQDISAAAPVKLDQYAAEFIKSTGMKEEDAQKALQGDMPLYLRGRAN